MCLLSLKHISQHVQFENRGISLGDSPVLARAFSASRIKYTLSAVRDWGLQNQMRHLFFKRIAHHSFMVELVVFCPE